MATFRVVHISDTHLGYAGELDCTGEDGVSVRESDLYGAFSRAVDEIIKIKPDAVVHTGDFFDKPCPTNRAVAEGIAQLKRLAAAGIPTVLIAGNHSTPRTSQTIPILKVLDVFDNVHVIYAPPTGPGMTTVKLAGGQLAIHGVPHHNDQAAFLAALAGSKPVAGVANVLLLHTSVSSQFMMDEFGESVLGEEHYGLLQGYDYIGLGHWHKFQTVKGLANAWYSGSTERLSEREAEQEKGYALVEIAAGKAAKVQFKALPARPWYRYTVPGCHQLSTADIRQQLMACAGEKPLCGALVSVSLLEVSEGQVCELTTAAVREVFAEAMAVSVRTSRHDAAGGLAAGTITTRTVDELFADYARDCIAEPGERKKMLAEWQEQYAEFKELNVSEW